MTDTSELVKRIRFVAFHYEDEIGSKGYGVLKDAITTLEAKDAEIKRLREVLGLLIELDADETTNLGDWGQKQEKAITEARSALTPQKGEAS